MSDGILVPYIEQYLRDCQDPDYFGSLEPGVQMRIAEAHAAGRGRFSHTLNNLLGLREFREPQLSASNLGQCPRRTWMKINGRRGELLPPRAKITFALGDAFELYMLILARIAAILNDHIVVREELIQKRLEDDGIPGHFDIPLTVDGTNYLGEVKIRSHWSYERERTEGPDDQWGYPHQVNHGCRALEAYTEEKWEWILWLLGDKNMGDFTEVLARRDDDKYIQLARETKRQVYGEVIPDRPDHAMMKRNVKKNRDELDSIVCQYCDVNVSCWDGLECDRTGKKPVYYVSD